METIKVKRNSNSRGKCKLSFNKVYTAIQTYKFGEDFFKIGQQHYPKSWFTPVPDQQPKPKPVVKPDPKTGKFVVEKLERDWSKPVAFPNGYEIPKGVRVVKVGEDDRWVRKGSFGVTISNSSCPFVKWENENYNLNNIDGHWNQQSFKLAPLNPTDHPEHPDFGKVNRVVHTKNAEVTTVDTTGTEQAPKTYKELPIPKPKHDIRDTIAEYVRKYGHELTAIELIGHLTIDKQ